jgi:hypothetical protein
MAWTRPCRDKTYTYVLSNSRQGQEILGGQFMARTRDFGWTIHGRDKTYWVDNSHQGQEILVGQFLAGTRHTGLTIPTMDKRFWLDNSWQGQDMLGWQFPAEIRDFGWTIHGRDKTYWVDNSRQGQETFLTFKSPLLALVHTPPAYSTDSGVKRSGCDFDHSSPYNGEVMNEWSYTSSSPVLLHGV